MGFPGREHAALGKKDFWSIPGVRNERSTCQTHCRYEACCRGAEPLWRLFVLMGRPIFHRKVPSQFGTPDSHLAFADIRSPGTMFNIKKNPSVEINVVDPFSRKGYRFKGTAEVVVAGELFQEIMSFYRGRWVDTAKSTTERKILRFVLVKVETALPLISPAYDNAPADEESIRKHWISYFVRLNDSAPR